MVLLEGWYSWSMLAARVEQSILADEQTAWLKLCTATFWSTMDSNMFVSLNFEWRENCLHLVTLTHSNIFKFKKPHPLCLCFLIRFSEEEAKVTEDFHLSTSYLFKNKIRVGNSQLCLTYAQIYSNLRKTTHSAFVFTFGFLKKWPKWHRTFICLLLVYLITR